MLNGQLIFLIMVFMAIFFLFTSLVPALGNEAKAMKRLRRRMKDMTTSVDAESSSLIRDRYASKNGPFAQWLENLPGADSLKDLLEQAGMETPAHRVLILMLVSGIFAGTVAWLWSANPIFALVAIPIPGILTLFKLRWNRNRRINQFEQQLPDALNAMTRALRAGHPFNHAMKFVSEEMSDPIAGEFRRTFADINYGMNIKAAFMALMGRMPSMSLMAIITAILIQKETGGDLAEILDKISETIRGRFRFQRKLRSLSAEGRLSAWILTLIPFVLGGMLFFLFPKYLIMLTADPTGKILILIAFINILIGILLMRRIIRIEV